MTWLFVVLGLALGCGGGGTSASTESEEPSSGGEGADLSPEGLTATYERNGQFMTSGPWAAPGGPLAEHAQEALEALRTWATTNDHSEVYHTLEVVSADWSPVTNDVTGAVIGRSFAGVALAQFPDGSCMQYAGSFMQEAVGGDYADAIVARGMGAGFAVPCEMIDVVKAREGVGQ